MNSAFDQHENGDSFFFMKDQRKNDGEIQEIISFEGDLLNGIRDWNRIARKQRVNTDFRRAIFISIISA